MLWRTQVTWRSRSRLKRAVLGSYPGRAGRTCLRVPPGDYGGPTHHCFYADRGGIQVATRVADPSLVLQKCEPVATGSIWGPHSTSFLPARGRNTSWAHKGRGS